MALQSQNLVMVGLGIESDNPPNSIQPQLIDGVHLRWSFKRELGFPWNGFYLFRRLHRESGRQGCLSQLVGELPVGTLPKRQLNTIHGFILSDHNLVITEDFSQASSIEFDLADRSNLQFQFNQNDPAYKAQVRIGFRETAKIKVTGLSWDVPIFESEISGKAGKIETVTFDFDVITSIEIGAGPAALIELCFVPVSQNLKAGWEPVPGFKFPMCLPLTHPDYPCSDGLPVDLKAAEETALKRIHYELPASWNDSSFKGLHNQLLELVVEGPAGTAMANRSSSWVGEANPPDPQISSPRMPNQRPLDLVLLGSLQPAIAQLLGLYWVDRSEDLDKAHDYLIVADHSNSLGGNIKGAMKWLGNMDFTDVDGYIVFNKKRKSATPLSAPKDLQAYALSGSNVRVQGDDTTRSGSNNIGLRWVRGVSGLGVLLPGKPLMYHLWRSTLGDVEPTSAPPIENYDLVTKERALLVSEHQLSSGQAPQRPQDWPPFPLHAFDNRLAEGWYSYQVSGIDIFGRHSPNSDPAKWFQWQPIPDPTPWYYQTPESDMAVHPFAVRLLDKMPPPSPAAMEAFALDPKDSTVLRDANFDSWFSTLSATEQDSAIGLRVRWQWTDAHQRQAPDVREFRVYLHPGTQPPQTDTQSPQPAHSVVANWEERIYVVNVDDHLPITPDDAEQSLRRYEIFLPGADDTFRNGLSFTPTLANPIVYAHIAVSAVDDKTHTLDDSKWEAGRWGGEERFGNEGRLSAPAKIYRVLRTLPEAPTPPPSDSDKVFATSANYHSHSFYTYRWKPVEHLKTHIFRALDDAIFKKDWLKRPREPLSADNPAHLKYFPSEVSEPSWTDEKRQQVTDELNSLNSFEKNDDGKVQAMAFYRGLSNDASRVLAGLEGNESAFSQITIKPLDPNAADNSNKLGPDNAEDFSIDSELRIFIDTLDGRSTNRYFYRAAYTDGAHNRGRLSLASAPVCLPNVVPPRAPVITKILGGDRQITITWASNRELDLKEYRIYRADSKNASRDLRLMTHVHTEVVSVIEPDQRPPEISWTNTSLRGLSNFYYRVTAVSDTENISSPSFVSIGRAYDNNPPIPPTWERAEWVQLDSLGREHPLNIAPPEGESWVQAVALNWITPEANSILVQRKSIDNNNWNNVSMWLDSYEFNSSKGEWLYHFYDTNADFTSITSYRLKSESPSGNLNIAFDEREVIGG